jgi:hypothetical protein
MGDLESQLMRFPSGTNDDLLDSLSVGVRMLSDAPTTRTEKAQTQNDKFDALKEMFSSEKKFTGFTGSKHTMAIPAQKSFMVKSKS